MLESPAELRPLPHYDASLGNQSLSGTRENPFDDNSSGDAARWLGVDAFPTEIRQSNINDYQRCRRYFMLRHRFRLVPKGIFLPHAPTRGTLFHLFMADYYSGVPEDESVAKASEWLDSVIEDATKLVEEGHPSVTPDSLDRLNEQSEELVALARVMFRAFINVYPRQDYEKPLLVEQNIKVRQKGLPVSIGGILDKLFIDERTNEVKIRDYKSVSRRPLNRVRRVSFDPQQLVYRLLASAWLAKNRPDLKLAGMIHSVIEEPGIEFGREDRDYTIVKHTFTRGKRKGQTEDRRVYEEDAQPKFENYLKRVVEKYTATGRYADEYDKRLVNPMIVQSDYPFSGPLLTGEFHTMLHEVGKACRAKPKLARFYRVWQSCFDYERPCEYTDLCVSAPSLWKGLVQERFMQVKER